MRKPASNMNTKSKGSTKETSAETDRQKAGTAKGNIGKGLKMPKSHSVPKATGMGKKGY